MSRPSRSTRRIKAKRRRNSLRRWNLRMAHLYGLRGHFKPIPRAVVEGIDLSVPMSFRYITSNHEPLEDGA